ncbi:hypothetical protein [Chryseobacterium oryzae]|uniref:Lipoprotein n=1 Tax=Chryseobacterium oryzae TaxID=2929799 RepID=A0ABY4BKH1_9FLAO|nr:hypothetical protein [Chryseobacterium oryzae]UOE39698.1 hypothetical protein MTP08_14720 [Chryseobacterium oryzae]
MRKIILGAAIIVLASCSNPTNKKYNEKTMSEDLKEIAESKKWSEEDSGLFAGWLLRAKFKGESLESKSYQDILDEAKKYKAEEEVLAEKAKKEAEARKQKMKNAITVTIFGKGFVKSDWEKGITDDYNLFDYAIENKSGKEVKAAKIKFRIYNSLGDQLGDDYIMDFTDDRIAPRGRYQNQAAFSYNQFKDDDAKIASAKFEDLIFDFDVEKIVYSDGSVLE